MVTAERIVKTKDGAMRTTVVHPEDGKHPAVVFYMAAPGVTPTLLDLAHRLASAGYYVAIPDGYYRFGEGVTFNPGDPEDFERMRATLMQLTDAMVVDDTRALIEQIASDPAVEAGPMGAMGFCMGARHALRAMSELPAVFAAGSGLHPAFIVTDQPDSVHRSLGKIKGGLYVGFGSADQTMPVELVPEFVAEAEAQGVKLVWDVFEGAGHGYMFPDGSWFDEAAAERSWERTLDLFGRTFEQTAVSA